MQRFSVPSIFTFGKPAWVAALCLASLPVLAQTSIDTAFARKLYSAGHDDQFHVRVGLKNTAYWILNDTLKLDKPVACDKSRQDCSPASFRLVEVIDTARTDAFFRRHEIKAAADAQGFLTRPPGYARDYEVFISPTEVLLIMQDTLVQSLVDLEPRNKTGSTLVRVKSKSRGSNPAGIRRFGSWLLGRRQPVTRPAS